LKSFLLLVKIFLNGTIFSSLRLVVKLFLKNCQGEREDSPNISLLFNQYLVISSNGNLGDWKRLENAQGVCEMREHSGAGYRVYFGFVGKTVILLLAGSDKGDQNRVIARAKQYWDDYQRRTKP